MPKLKFILVGRIDVQTIICCLLNCVLRDLAEEKRQDECVAFLRSPRHHLQNWIQQKRQLQGAWQLSEGERDHINEVVKAPIKKRMSFSFLSKIKVRRNYCFRVYHTSAAKHTPIRGSTADYESCIRS